MNFKLMASMMCANYGNLENEVKQLEAGEIDSFHIDIKDGCYVSNHARSFARMEPIWDCVKRSPMFVISVLRYLSCVQTSLGAVYS